MDSLSALKPKIDRCSLQALLSPPVFAIPAVQVNAQNMSPMMGDSSVVTNRLYFLPHGTCLFRGVDDCKVAVNMNISID